MAFYQVNPTDKLPNDWIERAGTAWKYYREEQFVNNIINLWRVFAVGDDANLPLLRMLSRNGGVMEQVLSTEPVEFKLAAFLGKVGRAPIGDLRLTAVPQAINPRLGGPELTVGQFAHAAMDYLISQDCDGDGLIEKSPPAEDGAPVADVTRDPTEFPAGRDMRLQTLARGDEGFLLGLGYSTQRGYGRNHPFVGEIRCGEVEVEMFVAELGFAVPLGSIAVAECQMVNQFAGGGGEPARFTRGYGLAFGQSERKAMSMALVDRALRADELAEEQIGPAQDAEFVLSHCDNVQATGFVEHLKLPHYVDFQAELALLRALRREAGAPSPTAEAAE